MFWEARDTKSNSEICAFWVLSVLDGPELASQLNAVKIVGEVDIATP